MVRRVSPIAFIASATAEARAAQVRLSAFYGAVPPEKASTIVALGGDGFMLETLHAFMNSGQPIYGMNCGSVGFLMNEFRERLSAGCWRRSRSSIRLPCVPLTRGCRCGCLCHQPSPLLRPK
jgi:NAD+ kinase